MPYAHCATLATFSFIKALHFAGAAIRQHLYSEQFEKRFVKQIAKVVKLRDIQGHSQPFLKEGSFPGAENWKG